MEETQTNKDSLDHYIALTAAAISNQRYKEALRIINEGLEKSIESEQRADIRKMLTSFNALLTILGFHLQEAYGDDWEDKIETPERQEAEIRCSFCGKDQTEVIQIIAGTTVYICNECIAISNEIITERNKDADGWDGI